ncbi:hypothetical protein BGZ54_001446, partial [Gamsiella multidivaricata]
VICASFADDRIASVRYLWDNASVLKMVKLIGSRHSWPIVAEAQIDALRDPTRFRLNPFGNATTATAGSRPQSNISKIFSSPPTSPPQRSNTADQKKGHPALTSTVFSHLRNAPLPGRNADEEDQSHRNTHTSLPMSPSSSDESLPARNGAASPTSPGKKGHPALTSTVFSHLKGTQSPPPSQPAPAAMSRPTSPPQHEEEERGAGWRADYVKPKGHPALTSSIFSKTPSPQPTTSRPPRQDQALQSPPAEEERGAGWRADYVKPKGHPALTSTIFSQQQPMAQPTPARPYKKTSHNIFGVPAEEQDKTKAAEVIPVNEEQEQEQEVPGTYTLEPSAIAAELERNEQQLHELKIDTASHNPSVDELEKKIQEQEALNEQEELEQAKKTADAAAAAALEVKATTSTSTSPRSVNAPLSPASPPPSARRIHPNYRTSFTIGGPR